MKPSAFAMLMLMAGKDALGDEALGPRELHVSVCTNVTFANSNDLNQIHFADQEAARIFATIGVKIDWRTRRCCPSAEAIEIDYQHLTPEELRPRVLAFAFPFQKRRIVILYDRVTELAASNRMTVNRLLAYVLLHEITHVLQGVDTHSASGI